MLLLDLNFADVAGVLNDLGDVSFVTSTNFSGDAFGQIAETSIHPVLPEHTNSGGTNTGTKRCNIRLNHAERTMDRPEEKEDDKHVVCIPESFVVGSSGFLHRGDNHTHQCNEHDIASPSRARDKVGKKPSVNTEFVLDCDLSEVVPMSDCMHPRPKDNRPSCGDVEGDVLVKLNDAVQRSLSEKGDESSADGKQNDSNINVKDQSR